MNWICKKAAASTSDVSRDATPPPDLTREEAQLNESVWKLYSPVNRTPEVDIIFFHGLQMGDYKEAFWKTWVARDDEKLVWPKDWLSEEFPNARILSVSYDSRARREKSADVQGDLVIVGENLLHDIVLDARYGIGQNCPVFLVGHCLGGIVIKQFILSVIHQKQLMPENNQGENYEKEIVDRMAKFLENMKGAFFYGTPSGGIPAAAFEKRISNPSPILQYLKVLDTDMGRINHEFRLHREKKIWPQISIFAVAEGRQTNHSGFNGIVVPEASVRNDVDGYYTHVEADHFTVCKARKKTDSVVIGKLSQFISTRVPAIKWTTTTQEAELL